MLRLKRFLWKYAHILNLMPATHYITVFCFYSHLHIFLLLSTCIIFKYVKPYLKLEKFLFYCHNRMCVVLYETCQRLLHKEAGTATENYRSVPTCDEFIF